MKALFIPFLFNILFVSSSTVSAQTTTREHLNELSNPKYLFLDVHQLTPGKVKFEDVAKAHAKDLAVQNKYGVNMIKYWVNEEKGLVYCLASASDSESLRKTHAEAHGLLPLKIFPVTQGESSAAKNKKNLFLDVHQLTAGKVTAKDVAEAHKKDMAVQKKHGVNIINYWFDEKEGIVMCLAEAKNAASLIETHREAHGLVPDKVVKVKEGE